MKKFCKKFGVLLPMNIQLFAEEGEGEKGSNGAGTEGTGGKKPSYEDLVAQLATANAQVEKLKSANDKSSKQAAEYKRRLREKMTPEELDAEETNGRQDESNSRLKELEAELAKMKAVKRYMASYKADEKTAEQFAQLEAEGKADELAAAIGKHIEALEKAAFAKALSDRPETHAGNSGGETQAEKIAKALKSRSSGIDENILKQFI